MSDSFLPSGAIEPPSRFFGTDLSTSPVRVPRSVLDYISAPSSNVGTPTYMPSPSQRPMSPPKTPSASVPGSQAALVEDWRAYTQKLRSQHEGERAHMAADRARMEEVMAEERGLWDKERDVFKARIAELEALLASKKGHTHPNTPPVPLPLPVSRKHPAAAAAAAITYSPGSNAVSTGSIGSASQTVPQESGRDADGSPFYAPAPRNPSRTFDPTETAELRLDSITAPRESAIRVTSKELTASDFGVQSPASTHDLQTIDESPAESIDISHIQPELEGVAIRASAVSPTFVAKVLSPYRSPPHLGSAETMAPARDITNQVRSPPARKEKHQKTLDIVHQAENRRLTLHAGHTPNHSISQFPLLGEGESGNATPTQEHHHAIDAGHELGPTAHTQQDEAREPDQQEDDQGDKELSGPLGITNEAVKDDEFVAQLVEKLEEVRQSAGTSPSTELERSPTPPATHEDRGEEKDEGPKLRLKPSCNFGKPLGMM
ncbi:hypothetical protein QTJ16_006738 [Diplocarpon rosae]|uniref:Uncharacterized protein n=1 Tax=Diplocarpon rosae TaxID=946125 RepID=A0AAD9SVX5_9HELO|nr:hypothetical protein QTJ16_006738 [Diplocarpon rosae]PBP24657.1 hypothetical protein BUE80_DR004445 [Diplocarpon rosae]